MGEAISTRPRLPDGELRARHTRVMLRLWQHEQGGQGRRARSAVKLAPRKLPPSRSLARRADAPWQRALFGVDR